MPARSAGPEMTAHSTTMAATIVRSAHVTSYRLTGRNVPLTTQTAAARYPGYPSEGPRTGHTDGTVKRRARGEGDADDRHRWNTEKQEA